jgi:hypothetical protein
MKTKFTNKYTSSDYFMSLLEETKKASYVVTGVPNDFYTVRNKETDEIVLHGMYTGKIMGWLVGFSEDYWITSPETGLYKLV